jgi:chemotaxis signal transduction protein
MVKKEQFLVFDVCGDLFALALKEVAEVIEPPTLYPLPKAPDAFAGVINFHGMPVPALNLSSFLGSVTYESAKKVVVLNPAIANLALIVSDVINIITDCPVMKRVDDRGHGVEKAIVNADGDNKLMAAGTLLDILEAGISGKSC